MNALWMERKQRRWRTMRGREPAGIGSDRERQGANERRSNDPHRIGNSFGQNWLSLVVENGDSAIA